MCCGPHETIWRKSCKLASISTPKILTDNNTSVFQHFKGSEGYSNRNSYIKATVSTLSKRFFEMNRMYSYCKSKLASMESMFLAAPNARFHVKTPQTPSEYISSSGRYIIRSIVDETQLEALKAMSDFLSFNQQQHTHVIHVRLGGNFASTNQNIYPRNLDRN